VQGGELRRKEQLISRTRVFVDRVGAYNDMGEGVFRMPSPPYLRHDRSRIGAEVRYAQLDHHKLTSS
jgi:hypothetical protein